MVRQQGFTILEIIVAFSILAVVTMVTVGLVTQNSMRVSRIDHKLQLLEQAESVMAELHLRVSELRQTEMSASHQFTGKLATGHDWHAMIKPMAKSWHGQTQSAFLKANDALPLWEVKLDIMQQAKQGRALQLTAVLPGR